MKELPILFSTPMVRAILAGTKTQTRRVVKPQPSDNIVRTAILAPGKPPLDGCYWEYGGPVINCPKGRRGDRLWVRETSFIWGRWVKNGHAPSGRQKWRFKIETPHTAIFDANHPQVAAKKTSKETCCYWRRPSIHMPRWACRIELEITGIRVERLQDISEQDAIAEGCAQRLSGTWWQGYRDINGELMYDQHRGDSPPDWMIEPKKMAPTPHLDRTAKQEFQTLWFNINGVDSWALNPWVWVVEFKKA